MLDSQGIQKDHLTENILRKTSYQLSTGLSWIFWNQIRKEKNSSKAIKNLQK
jgi:hypothetical protein